MPGLQCRRIEDHPDLPVDAAFARYGATPDTEQPA
jgi:hypothetical protein